MKTSFSYLPQSRASACAVALLTFLLSLTTVNSRAQQQAKPVPLPKAKQPGTDAGKRWARALPVRVDPSAVIDRRGMGKAAYSTGLEPVWIRIIPKRPPQEMPYLSRIYVLSQGKKRYVGTNRDNKNVSLGVLPAEEIQIMIDTQAEGVSSSGSADRNPDQLPHAIVRDLPDGTVEVRFEGSLGLPEEKLVYGSGVDQEYARRNHFGDVILRLSGGVTADRTVLLLLESLRSSNPEVRKTAAAALQQAHPGVARAAGLNARAPTRR